MKRGMGYKIQMSWHHLLYHLLCSEEPTEENGTIYEKSPVCDFSLHLGCSMLGQVLGHQEHWDWLSKCELMTMNACKTWNNFSCRTYKPSFNPDLPLHLSGPRISNGQPSCLWWRVPRFKHDKSLLLRWQISSSCGQYLSSRCLNLLKFSFPTRASIHSWDDHPSTWVDQPHHLPARRSVPFGELHWRRKGICKENPEAALHFFNTVYS